MGQQGSKVWRMYERVGHETKEHMLLECPGCDRERLSMLEIVTKDQSRYGMGCWRGM